MKTLASVTTQSVGQSQTGSIPLRARVRTPDPTAATLQRTVSNQAMQHLLRTHAIQAQLTVNTPNDQFEQEADRVADQVMCMSSAGASEPPPSIQRACTSCTEEREARPIQRMCKECDEEVQRQQASDSSVEIVQRVCDDCEDELQHKGRDHSAPDMTAAVESQISALQSGGVPLATQTRSFFEPRFGRDFSDVRVHVDASAAATAQSVNALAYTRGHHIVFGAGQYQPNTSAGRRLLAHELVHVTQQSQPAIDSIQRAPCPRTPTHIADRPLDPALECDQRTDTVGGAVFLFCTDSDQMQDDSERLLPSYIPSLRRLSVVEVHGYASQEGPRGREAAYNLNLSCMRANRAAALLQAQGIPASRIRRFKHGGTSVYGPAEQNRAVIIPIPNVHQFRTAAVSMLACAPCNPFTDDGPQALSPPASEAAITSFRQKHSISAEILSVDGRHIEAGSPGVTGTSQTLGMSGYCGREYPAFQVSMRAPSGAGTNVVSTVHGEGREWRSELRSRVGAVVPCTLVHPTRDGAPCGNLGPNPRIPAIGNQFFMRLFADGTAESGFISASGFPFHYLYENGRLKMHGSAPVHPVVDFHSWATSTGVSEEQGLAGLKALRKACCDPPLACPCECRNGASDLTSDPVAYLGTTPAELLAVCVGSAAAFLTMSCPAPCHRMGTDCDIRNLPANPTTETEAPP